MGEANIRAEQKKKAFEENPDDFLNVKDLLFAAMRGKDGQLQVMNNCLTMRDCLEVKGWAERTLSQRMDAIEIRNIQKNQPAIVTPGQALGNGHNPIPIVRG